MYKRGFIFPCFALQNKPVIQALNAPKNSESMSYDDRIENLENDVLTICIGEVDGCYFMWKKGLTEDVGSEDGIYFEFDDKVNGGANIVKECTVTNDGVHVVLTSGDLKHLYFPSCFGKHDELKRGLNKIYEGEKNVVEYCI